MAPEVNFLSTITGSFAHPAAENPTIAMIQAAYAHHSIDAQYLNCDVGSDDLADAVRGARAMGWLGFNCSLPHKVAVIGHLDRLARSASIIRAVNCVVARDGALVGENTDGVGFLDALRTVADPRGARVVLLGAGGAARAIAVELALAGAAHITIVNRSTERAAALAEILTEVPTVAVQTSDWPSAVPYRLPPDTQVLVNATSIGLFPDVSARPDVDPDSLRSATVVADVIPNPPHTPFLDVARRAGCVTLDGLGMLVNQGRVAVELWTGLRPDADVMRSALLQALSLNPSES